jgi:hypothetical protein
MWTGELLLASAVPDAMAAAVITSVDANPPDGKAA